MQKILETVYNNCQFWFAGEKSQNGGGVETGRSKWHKGESKAAELNKKIQERKIKDTSQMTKSM